MVQDIRSMKNNQEKISMLFVSSQTKPQQLTLLETICYQLEDGSLIMKCAKRLVIASCRSAYLMAVAGTLMEPL
jgi:hypothetical protein